MSFLFQDCSGACVLGAGVSDVSPWRRMDESRNWSSVWPLQTFRPAICCYSWPIWSPAIQSKYLFKILHYAVCIKLIWTIFLSLFFFFVETICWGSQGTLLQHLWQVNKGSGRNRDRAKDLHIWRWSWETQERAARQVIQPHSWAGETLSESTTAAQNLKVNQNEWLLPLTTLSAALNELRPKKTAFMCLGRVCV